MQLKYFVLVPAGMWFLYDTAGYWLPNRWLPFVSYFRREWMKNPATQEQHFRVLVNAILFGILVQQLITDEGEVDGLRNPSNEDRSVIERGMERMMQTDFERHSKAMETLLHKHKMLSYMR
eukprot:Sspe_Gene.64724::Locus_38343_Transcript_1_1_Confidence_1.000_Length_593::g.64724::m.64724